MSTPSAPAQIHPEFTLRQIRGRDPGVARINRWFSTLDYLSNWQRAKRSKLGGLYKYWFKWQSFVVFGVWFGLMIAADAFGWLPFDSTISMSGLAIWAIWFALPFVLLCFTLIGMLGALLVFPCLHLIWALIGFFDGRYRQPKRIDLRLQLDGLEIEGHVSEAGQPKGRISRTYPWLGSNPPRADHPLRTHFVQWPPPRKFKQVSDPKLKRIISDPNLKGIIEEDRNTRYEEWVSSQMATGELPSHKGRYGWALIVRTADGRTRTYPNIQDDDEKIRRLHAELRHAIDEAVLRHGRGEDEVPEELRGMLHDESRS